MRTVMSASEVIHVWAAQGQDSARTASGNCYFNGATLYSYGTHYPMGRHVTGTRGRAAVLLNSRSSSVTTNKHMGWTRQAVRHLETFNVPLEFNTGKENPAEYLKHYAEQVAEYLEKASKARGRKLEWFNAAVRTVDEANRLAEFFGIRKRMKVPADLESAIADAKAEKEKADRKNAKALAERAKRQAAELERVRLVALAAVEDWRAGRIQSIPGVNSYFNLLGGDLLRMTDDGQTVQTSRGATVPMPHFRRAFRTLKRLADDGREYHANGHSIAVGHYRIAHMAGGTVAVGCHNFQWSEVLTFATRAGLDVGPTTVADVPDCLTFTADPNDVAMIKRNIGPAAAPFQAFFVGQRDGEYVELWGIMGTVPNLDARAWKIIPPAPYVEPMPAQCSACNGRGNVQGERCFRCQGYGITSTEGGAK